MSSDTEAAERGAELQARRQARALDDARGPWGRFLDEAPELLGIDWESPNEFPRAQRQVPMLVTGAQRNRARAPRLAPGNWAVLRGGAFVGGFDALMTSLPSALGVTVTRSRPLTQTYLAHSGIPTPRTRSFDVGDEDAARAFAAELGRAVVKPGTGRRGRGVSTDLRIAGPAHDRDPAAEHTAEGPDEFSAAFAYAASRIWTRRGHSRQVIVQEHHDGLDVRALVVVEDVVGAVARIPLFVVGDGTTTLGALTRRAAARRVGNTFFSWFRVELGDDQLRLMGLDPDQVLEPGRRQAVSPTSNPLAGGITVDVTDLLDSLLCELAVDAVWSLPDVKAAGVDLIVPSLGSAEAGSDGDGSSAAEGAVVTEFREDPVLGLHGFPLYGRSRSTATPLMEALITRAGD